MQLDLSFSREPEKPGKPETAAPRVLSVTDLTRAVRTALEGALGTVWVRGEISNHRRQASGHQYFTLKDAGAQLACVLFAGAARSLRGLRLVDGMQVQLLGEVTVYEARGQYQLVVELVQEEGLGALQARFEALKARLAAEGLFDAERKRALPRLPRRVGVVTSPTGAALRDFLHVLGRRFPGVAVIVNPVRVQGRGAAAEIARAVAEFSGAPANGFPAVDVIVVTRGGGSLEDLWEFNEEAVARAIADSVVPVVSAVGHEIDFSLADFAADLRAPTPSAAAEILVPEAAELRRGVADRAERGARVLGASLRLHAARLAAFARSALHDAPNRRVREQRQRLDGAVEALAAAVRGAGRSRREALARVQAVIAAHRPTAALALRRMRLEREQVALAEAVGRGLERRRARLESARGLLRSLSPEATLARGYSITFDADGRVVRSAEGLAAGDALRTKFAEGEVEVRVVRGVAGD